MAVSVRERAEDGEGQGYYRLSQGTAGLSCCLKEQVFSEVRCGALTGSVWVSVGGWK